MAFRENWHIPESPVEDKDAYRQTIKQDVEDFLARGGRVEQGVSVQLRCVRGENSHSETRVIYAKTDSGRSGQDSSRAELSAGFSRYGRGYTKASRSVRAGLRSKGEKS